MEIVTAHKTIAKLEQFYAPAASVPFNFGVQDALAGELCVPEMYFIHPSDKADYAAGWASICGQNDTTRLLSRGRRQLAADVNFDAETEDLADYMADVEFWRSGAW